MDEKETLERVKQIGPHIAERNKLRRDAIAKEIELRPVPPHIAASWVWPGHFMHLNNTSPQLCIYANGWKAIVLSWFFRPTNPSDKYPVSK